MTDTEQAELNRIKNDYARCDALLKKIFEYEVTGEGSRLDILVEIERHYGGFPFD